MIKGNILGVYQNGNTSTTILTDGTRIRFTKDDEFKPEFADNIDIKITDRCDAGCPFCHEGSTKFGAHGNLREQKFWDTLKPYQEVALGGGNVLEHPDFIWLLEKLKSQKVIANVTLNQVHFEKNAQLIKDLQDKGLLYGVGVSFREATDEFFECLNMISNAVVHVIVGIVSKQELETLADHNVKILFLGYKSIRRGASFGILHGLTLIDRRDWLKNHIKELAGKFKVFSFDCLAVEQLDAKSIVTEGFGENIWETMYSGDDGTHTFYIDAVKGEFSVSSVDVKHRTHIENLSVTEMFNKVQTYINQ